jgi:hypothetical protein
VEARIASAGEIESRLTTSFASRTPARHVRAPESVANPHAMMRAPSSRPAPERSHAARPELSRRTDGELLYGFRALVVDDRRSTSALLAHMGEIRARRLFRPLG